MTAQQLSNPYVGPFSFGGADEGRFFGRKKEADEVMSLIQKSKLTILFGSSGTGKTSLIHAKLLPQLKREYFHPIYIRINFASANPLAYTRKRIADELQKWIPDIPRFDKGQSLLEYAAHISIFKGLVKPVLFFDQFEELFTLGPLNDPIKIRNFIAELSDLVETRLPDELKSQEYIDNIRNFKVVFSLRQDWIAYLEDYSHVMPSVLENRYRLRKLAFSQAEEAIYCPAEKIISREAARTIIGLIGEKAIMKDISEDAEYYIEQKNRVTDPFVLSLYCFELYEKFAQTDEQFISSDFVEKHDPKEIIRNYYHSRTVGEEAIKLLIEKKLVNESGKRMTLSLDDFTEKQELLKQKIKAFATVTGIVRITGEEEKSEIEIVHDKLAIEAFENRTRTIREEATEKERRADELQLSAKKAEEEAEKMRLSAERAEESAERMRLSAKRAEEEADKMRLSAKKAKIITGVVVLVGLILAILSITSAKNYEKKLKKEAEGNLTIKGLQDQLKAEKENNDIARTEIVALEQNLDVLRQTNSSSNNVPQFKDTFSQYKIRYDQEMQLVGKARFVIDSLRKAISQMTVDNNLAINQLRSEKNNIDRQVSELSARLSAIPNIPTTQSFDPKSFNNFKIANDRNADNSINLPKLKKHMFLDIAFVKPDYLPTKGSITIKVNFVVDDLPGNQIPSIIGSTNPITFYTLRTKPKSIFSIPLLDKFNLTKGSDCYYDVIYTDSLGNKTIIYNEKFSVNNK